MRITRKCIWFRNKRELVDFLESLVGETINGCRLTHYWAHTKRSRRISLHLVFSDYPWNSKRRDIIYSSTIYITTSARYLGPEGYALSLDRSYDGYGNLRVNVLPVQIRDLALIWYQQKTKMYQVLWLFGLRQPKSPLHRLANHPYCTLPVIFHGIFSFLSKT